MKESNVTLNELKISEKIQVEPGTIKFPDSANLREQAQQIADFIRSVDRSPENVAQIKKVLAAANKAAKALSDKRIEIKRVYLVPYTEFETEIKEITEILSMADKELRDFIKADELAERQVKAEMIKTAYAFIVTDGVKKIASFDWFMKPEYLNKTATMAKIEKAIREFDNLVSNSVAIIEKMENSTDVMAEYIQSGGDLAGTLAAIQARNAVKERVKLVITENSEMIEIPIDKKPDEIEPDPIETNPDPIETNPDPLPFEPEPEFVFRVKGAFMAGVARRLLDKYGVEYEVTE